MLDTLYILVNRILEHPIAAVPVPDSSHFFDRNAQALFYQFHRCLVRLGQTTLHLTRARSDAIASTPQQTFRHTPQTFSL